MASAALIPARLGPLSRFRRWARSDDFPEGEKISYLNGELWIGMSPEDIFLHNLVKREFSRTLGTLVKVAAALGHEVEIKFPPRRRRGKAGRPLR